MPKGIYLSIEEILVENSSYQSNKTRLQLLKHGIKKHICEKCWNTTWNDLPIPLELEHLNGDNSDNRLENLKLYCPNCHAQTDSYRGKNKGKAVNKHHYKRSHGETGKHA